MWGDANANHMDNIYSNKQTEQANTKTQTAQTEREVTYCVGLWLKKKQS